MVVRAGLLDRRITLERRTVVVDDSGQPTEVYTPVAEVWARRETLGGSERIGQQQTVAIADLRYTIRYRDDIDPLHRVADGGRSFDVVSVVEEGRREALVILVRGRAEKVPA